MESEDILVELKELSSKDSIKKSELMAILKKYAHTISVYDLMGLSQRMRKEGEYLNILGKSIIFGGLFFFFYLS